MSVANGVKCWCQHCGGELEPNHTGECPYCGKTGKRCEATASVAIGVKVSASAEGPRVYFCWFNRKLGLTIGFILIDITLLLVSTVAGYVAGVLGPLFGALTAFVVSFIIIIIYNFWLKKRVENTKSKVMERV